MKTAFAMPLLWALACGCGTTDPIAPSPPPPRGLPKAASTDRPPPKPAAAPGGPEPFRWLDESSAQKPAAPVEASPDAGKRDYEAELRAALGDPSSCLAARTDAGTPSEISIEVEAYVMAPGNISRGYVRSPQLAAEELECIRRRITPLRLRPPIEDAPRAVRATLKLAVETSAKTGT
jgi:hypothetical protein